MHRLLLLSLIVLMGCNSSSEEDTQNPETTTVNIADLEEWTREFDEHVHSETWSFDTVISKYQNIFATESDTVFKRDSIAVGFYHHLHSPNGSHLTYYTPVEDDTWWWVDFKIADTGVIMDQLRIGTSRDEFMDRFGMSYFFDSTISLMIGDPGDTYTFVFREDTLRELRGEFYTD